MQSEKEYAISLSKGLYKEMGLEEKVYYSKGTDPQKAIKKFFEKLGYKIKINRMHSYSPVFRPADIMTELRVDTKANNVKNYNYTAFYTIQKLIELPKNLDR